MTSSCIHYLLNQLTMHVLSIDPVTMREQSQLNWALLISPRWPIKVCNNLPVPTSHTATVWSKEPVMILSPVVLKDRAIISAECP